MKLISGPGRQLYYHHKKMTMDFVIHKEVSIPVENVTVQGELIIPVKAKAIIIFSHGSGSSK